MVSSDALFPRLMHAVCSIEEIRQFDPVLEQIVTQALDLLDARAGYLIFIDEEGALDYRLRRDRQGNLIDLPNRSISQTIHQQVLQPRTLWAQQANGVATLAAPLIAHGRLIGAILLRDCAAPDQAEALLQSFADFAALAIENARSNEKLETIAGENKDAHGRLKQELERLSMIDPLTGIANHRHFYELGEQIFSRSQHPPYEMAALMLDLDHFSRINDQYGHVTGDAVLQIVVNRLLQGLRPSDLIGRYAGEKFAILLPRTAWDDACTVAERLRGGIESNMIEVGFNNIPLTISVGVAGLNAETRSLAELLSHADEALAIAKQRNGNRWVVWHKV